MRKSLFIAVFVAILMSLVSAASSQAQSPFYNPGPVWRVVYIHIKPGQGDAFWNDIRQNFKPIYDEQKKQGLILDYKFWTNPVADGPNDWDVAFGLLYANYAALDQVAAKAATITIQHYGTREAALDAAKKRTEISETVASKLAREVTLK
jgi:hypothetical protein